MCDYIGGGLCNTKKGGFLCLRLMTRFIMCICCMNLYDFPRCIVKSKIAVSTSHNYVPYLYLQNI